MTSENRSHSAMALYRALLRCYPRAFRDRFGEEMTSAFGDAIAACPTRGARVNFLASAVVDAVRSGAAERAVAWRSRPRTSNTHPAGDTAMQSIMQDLRFAIRSLGRRPGLVTAVVLTLALGVGANTAIFSLLDAVLLHPLPAVARTDEVVAIYRAGSGRTPYQGVSYPLFQAMADHTRSLRALAADAGTTAAVRIAGRAEELDIRCVSGNFFSLLGLRAQAGRLLTPSDDDVPGAHAVVVLSDAMWTSAFNRRPSAVGSTIRIGERPFTIIGVAPRGFRGTSLSGAPQLWVPVTMLTSLGTGGLLATIGTHAYTLPSFTFFSLVGRLRPTVTPSAAAAELTTIAKNVQRQAAGRSGARGNGVVTFDSRGHVVHATPRISVVPIVQAAALADRGSLVRFVTILVVVVALTLLIACVNVANLMLVRGSERAHELGVRAALGASRSRIARALFIESLLLALLGAAAGIGVGLLTMHLLSAFTLPGGIRLDRVDLSLDGRVLAFAVALAIATALLFGLVPALRSSRADLAAVIAARGTGKRRAPRGILAGVQVALSLLLLVGAALFARSLRAGLTTDLGFDPRPIAAVDVELDLHGYSTHARSAAYFDEAMARARRIHGVTAVAIASQVPLGRLLEFPLKGLPPADGTPADSTISAGFVAISPEYFSVLGVPLVRGRAFTRADTHDAPAVVMVNEAAARAFSPAGAILGKTLGMLGGDGARVVGIVRDTKYGSVRDEHIPVVFVPITQGNPMPVTSIITRSEHPAATLAALRRTVAAIDPNVSIDNPRLVRDQIDTVLMPQRFGATLLGIFALISLCVSAVGIYGVIAYGVSQRAPEIAVRIALGARHMDILRLVLLRTAVAVVVGGVVGLAASVAASRTLARFLYGITPLDATAFLGAVLLLAIAAAVASCTPAVRATRIDPMTTLRAE
ncbi:MAG TPA: ABC transporter permease [Gemmatimonadaceae bacterium]|nr:ABC transporter permease [Gemmatimonadaceae bacterium]